MSNYNCDQLKATNIKEDEAVTQGIHSDELSVYCNYSKVLLGFLGAGDLAPLMLT